MRAGMKGVPLFGQRKRRGGEMMKTGMQDKDHAQL
jgi:hypothetical protein